MQVQPSEWPISSASPSAVNFKKFRKVQPQIHEAAGIPFANKGYAENGTDNEAFLKWVLVAAKAISAASMAESRHACPCSSTCVLLVAAGSKGARYSSNKLQKNCSAPLCGFRSNLLSLSTLP